MEYVNKRLVVAIAGAMALVLAVIAVLALLNRPADGAGAAESGVAENPMGESASSATCRTELFEVQLDELGEDAQEVLGQFCVRGEADAETPIQVLLHGGAYDHHYWDWPYQPSKYSYVEHATRAGYATLNLDRLGYGASSRPDPELLDFDLGAEAVSQVVEDVRSGMLGPAFETVILNGHSMGGLVAERAVAYGGIDAAIVSGIAPDDEVGVDQPDSDPESESDSDPESDSDADADAGEPDTDAVPDEGPPEGEQPPFHPAQDDPSFSNEPWAHGYLTTVPGTREDLFLYPGAYDPAVLEFEESLKDTVPSAELAAVQSDDEPSEAEDGSPAEPDAQAPLVFVLGEHDAIACDGSDCMSDPEARAADYIVPGSVHSINVSHGATEFYEWTFEWLREQDLAD